MANIPTEEEVKKLQDENVKSIQRKIESQSKLGKEFVINEHSSGVIPESIWKNLPGKKLSDPEAVK